MPLLIKSKTLLFIHIPKSAGTSIKSFFRAHGYSIFLDTNRPLFHNGVVPQHLTSSELMRIGISASIDSFTVVRSPVKRCISEYYYRRLARRMNFEAFMHMYCSLVNSSAFSNHCRPQSDFVFDNTRVYKFEKGIDTVILELIDEFNLEIKKASIQAPHLYKSKENARQAHKVHSRTINRFVRLYGNDYSRFNYSVNEDCNILEEHKRLMRYAVNRVIGTCYALFYKTVFLFMRAKLFFQ